MARRTRNRQPLVYRGTPSAPQPRLLADFAAVPTARERAAARWTNAAAQLSLSIDDGALADEPSCPVCAGSHREDECRHGTAPTLGLVSFEVGRRYACRSLGDHECVWTFEVIDRTAMFVLLQEDDGQRRRVKVRVWQGVEACSPLGTYSLAPVLTAEKVAS